jgi:hypothetical protein
MVKSKVRAETHAMRTFGYPAADGQVDRRGDHCARYVKDVLDANRNDQERDNLPAR